MDENLMRMLLALIALLVTATIVIKISIKKNVLKTKQSNNVVGGDQAGRDINKK